MTIATRRALEAMNLKKSSGVRQFRVTAPVYKIYDGQYKKRDVRNANRISAFHLTWTILICMKEELDNEIKSRGKMTGALKRWSKAVDDEFQQYLHNIDRVIKKDQLSYLVEDYEYLDTEIRKACNIEQKTIISFGRLLHAMTYLSGFCNIVRERFVAVLDNNDQYCRSIMFSSTMIDKAMHNYIIEAGNVIKIMELPISAEDFTTMIMQYLYKQEKNGGEQDAHATTDN